MAKINNVSNRENAYYDFLSLSEATSRNYKNAINSNFILEYLKTNFSVNSIFEIYDLKKLWEIYSYINIHPHNIKRHRYYSAPIMQYIRFLNNGKKYGRRIDYKKRKDE